MMKVVHIVTTLEGGAGLAAARIIRSTKVLGVDVRVLVASGKKTEYIDVMEPINPLSKFWLIRQIQVVLKMKGLWPKSAAIRKRIDAENAKNHAHVFFTSPVTLYKEIAEHPWIKEADIVHLHWIDNFVDFESFFPKIKKPIVWTAHDDAPALGGFHYKGWKDNAIDSFKKLDDDLAAVKSHAFSGVKTMTMVVVSSKMKALFQKSFHLRKFPCVVIHNGIEEEKFSPISSTFAREALNIPAESKVFLFAAQDIHDCRKGLKELIEALEAINIPNTCLICLGNYHTIPCASFNIRCEGFVTNARLLSLYYSAANFYVMPSFEEAFGQVAVEALACGTPTVAFPNNGGIDIVSEKNGVVCADFTVEALAEGIQLAMSMKFDSDKIREDVINRFSYDKIAKQYVELYERILKEQA